MACQASLANFLASAPSGPAKSPAVPGEEETLLALLKSVYDATPVGPIPTLITEGFDEDQIWEEIELRNQTVLDSLSAQLQDKPASEVTGAVLEQEIQTEEEEPQSDDLSDDAESHSGDEEMESDPSEEASAVVFSEDEELGEADLHALRKSLGLSSSSSSSRKERKPTTEAFSDENEEEVEEGEDAEENLKYADFFESPTADGEEEEAEEEEHGEEGKRYKKKKRKVEFDLGGDEEDEAMMDEDEEEEPRYNAAGLALYDDDDEEEGEGEDQEEDEEEMEEELDNGLVASDDEEMIEEDEEGHPLKTSKLKSKSPHALQDESIRDTIHELEKQALADKNWTLRGEVSARDRPKNSLLKDEIDEMDIEYTMKPVPIITQDVTKTLEDIIKDRILRADFNDVVRKLPAPSTSERPRSDFEINENKPNKSLAEEYEAEYMSKVKGVPSERDVKRQQAHDEITALWKNLSFKLDALANAHYVPKQAKAEVKVLPSVAAIEMEEALPMSVSSAARLAPQEVVAPSSDVKAREELSTNERKAMRRQKKQRQKVVAKDKAQHEKAKATATTTADGETVAHKKTKEKEQQELGKLLSSMEVPILMVTAGERRLKKKVECDCGGRREKATDKHVKTGGRNEIERCHGPCCTEDVDILRNRRCMYSVTHRYAVHLLKRRPLPVKRRQNSTDNKNEPEMAKSIRAKSERANRNQLRTSVTGPHEAARTERLAAKLQAPLQPLLTDAQKRAARIAEKKARKGEMVVDEEVPTVEEETQEVEMDVDTPSRKTTKQKSGKKKGGVGKKKSKGRIARHNRPKRS